LGYSVLIHGGSACLFLGQAGVNGATLLAVMLFLLFLSSCKISSSN
jgi:hypothetical protein